MTFWYLTHWDLFDKKSQIHDIAAGLVPISINFGIAMFMVNAVEGFTEISHGDT